MAKHQTSAARNLVNKSTFTVIHDEKSEKQAVMTSAFEKEIMEPANEVANTKAREEKEVKEAFSDYCKRGRLRMRIWSGKRLPGHAKILNVKGGRWVLEVFTGTENGEAQFEYPAGVRGLKHDSMVKYLKVKSFPG